MASSSRLCELVTGSLLPYTEPAPVRLTKETEKDLLISLSLVCRQIQKWVNESTCDSGNEIVANLLVDCNCFRHLEQQFEGGRSCLANIVSTLVVFLTVESQFVQHLAGNILVAIHNFLAKYILKGNKWEELLCLLWISVEMAMSNICSCSSLSSPVGSIILADESLMHHYSPTRDKVYGAKGSDFGVESFIALLRSRLMNANWLMVAGLFRVLRNILKSLKHEYDDLKEVYMRLAVSSLLRMPWDLMSEIHVVQTVTAQMRSSGDGLLDKEISLSGSKDLLLGTMLQLLCSLVEQIDSETGGSSLDELHIYSKFINLVPKLLSYLCKHHGCKEKCVSQYLRHKVLMLMIRLSFHIHWQVSGTLRWLHLIRYYFEDIVHCSISECFENCLEGSPFFASVAEGDKVHNLSTRHLQRQTIFLLFKCCFTLVRISIETGQECACATKASSFTCELQICSKPGCHMGFSELSEWLQRHGFLEKFVDYKDYSKSCYNFALSFLQLYMEEDNMLFEMLLLLLDAPLLTLQRPRNANDTSLEEVNRETFFHVSSIFNPIHLFHLLLLLLHYDHLVLLDYLISKDTGVPCVKYLLRCLRMVCKSWIIFVEFPMWGGEINQPCYKKIKVFVDEDPNLNLGLLSSSSTVIGRQNMRKHKFGSTHISIRLPAFENAKECLLSLKRSVEDLHQKNLFPYNPKPLLKSFSRFQELCEQ